jgi:hypothetical protein
LIALIANARRSLRPPRSRKLALPKPTQNVAIRLGSLRVPPLKKRGRTGVGLFEKTSFASNASGNLSGQARLTTGLERLRDMRDDDKPRGSRPLAPADRPNAFPLHNVR